MRKLRGFLNRSVPVLLITYPLRFGDPHSFDVRVGATLTIKPEKLSSWSGVIARFAAKVAAEGL